MLLIYEEICRLNLYWNEYDKNNKECYLIQWLRNLNDEGWYKSVIHEID